MFGEKLLFFVFAMDLYILKATSDSCPSLGRPNIEALIPHPEDCSLYYRLDKCPNGLHFNPSKRICDRPSEAQCNSGGTTGTGGEGPGDSGAGSGAGPGESSSPGAGSPGKPGGSGSGGCPSVGSCPAVDSPDRTVILPHRSDCSSFCICNHGTPILSRCPSELRFNPKIMVCDWPKNVDCTAGSSNGSAGYPGSPGSSGSGSGSPRPPTSGPGTTGGTGYPSRPPSGSGSGSTRPPTSGSGSPSRPPSGSGSGSTRPPTSGSGSPSRPPSGSGSGSTRPPTSGSGSTGGSGSPSRPPSGSGSGSTGGSGSPSRPPSGSGSGSPRPPSSGSGSTGGSGSPSRPPSGSGSGSTGGSGSPSRPPSGSGSGSPRPPSSGSGSTGGSGSPSRPPSGSGSEPTRPPPSGSGSTGSCAGGEDNCSGNGTNGSSGETQEECLAIGRCPEVDPLEYTMHLPHQTDCNRFCVCDNGVAKNKQCPDGLHFNPKLQVCDWPQNVKCKRGCIPLTAGNGSTWSPPSCTERPGKLGEVCKIMCKEGYELKGSAMLTCTTNGWNGTAGVGIMPACKTPEDLGEDFVDKIAAELKGKDAGLLFVLDESGSVSKKHFALEIKFIKALVSAFPLSKHRSAGVITFSDVADVDILLSTSDTCRFLAAADRIVYRGGNTDIQKALKLAAQEIDKHAIHNLTLVFLVTDGISSTNPSSAAQKIRSGGNVLFTVGIADYERNQLEPISSTDKSGAPLFYGVTSFQVFNTVASYLDTAYNNGTSQNCAMKHL